MRVLVMGAGALGAYFGARLQAAGHEVTYIARGAHLEAMRARGLRIESPLGDLVLDEVRATDNPTETEVADVVLFMVKNYDVEAAGQQLSPALGPETIVITAQNGVSAPSRLASIIGASRVYPGSVYMPADIKAPGVIRHSSAFHRMAFGALEGEVGETARAFADAVTTSGPGCEISSNIRVTLWEKFILLSSLSAITALTRLDIGPIRDTPGTRELLIRAVRESHAVGQADCPGVPDDAADKTLGFLLETIAPHVHASMLDDLNRGRRIEIDYLSGDICRLGRKHDVPTPVHDFVTAALEPYANGPPA